MPADPWAQYAEKSPAAGSDPWAAYVQKDVQKDSSAASPIAPPAIQKPRVNMHPSFLLGDPDKDATPQSIGEVGKGIAKNLYQVSAPGIATSILKKRAPSVANALPSEMTDNASDIERLPGQMIENFALMGTPEGEGAEASTGARAVESRVAAPSAAVKPTAAKPAPGMAMRVGKVLANKIPGVKLGSDLVDAVKGPEPVAKPVAKPAPAPIPETNGIPWGTGGQGPIAMRGQRIPFRDPGANLPATPAPELIHPELTSEARSLPGQIGKEVIHSPVAAKIAPAEPIPPRSGLALPPGPEPAAAKAVPPVSATKPSAINPAQLEQQLNDALGGKPLERGVPIGKQRPLGNVPEQIREAVGPSQQPPRAPLGNLPKQINEHMNPLPEGFSPVDSSAIRGYKYNPAARELEAITNTGQHYVHGDVSPEEFEKFEAADSKGAAWNALRKAPGVTQVATVQKGARVPTRPGVLKTAKGVIAKSKAGMDPDADLTPQLEESVKQARKSRVARPK